MGEMDIINVVETSPASSEDEMEPGKEIQKQYRTRLEVNTELNFSSRE